MWDRQNQPMVRSQFIQTGFSQIAPVRAATTAALAANTYAAGPLSSSPGRGATLTANANGALAAQDGVSLAVGDRLLVLFESTAANNGVYVVTSLGGASAKYVLTRTDDACLSAQLAGAEIVVTLGTVNSGSTWFNPLDASLTIGTTGLTFLRVAAGLIHQVIAFSATPAFSLAESQQITLTGNITGWTLPAGVGDMEVTICFIQDGTGSRTLAGAGANIRLAGGALTLSTGANKVDTLTFKWNANLGTPAWVEKSRALNA